MENSQGVQQYYLVKSHSFQSILKLCIKSFQQNYIYKTSDPLPLKYPNTTHNPKSHQPAKLFYEINLNESEVYLKLIVKSKIELFWEPN